MCCQGNPVATTSTLNPTMQNFQSQLANYLGGQMKSQSPTTVGPNSSMLAAANMMSNYAGAGPFQMGQMYGPNMFGSQQGTGSGAGTGAGSGAGVSGSPPMGAGGGGGNVGAGIGGGMPGFAQNQFQNGMGMGLNNPWGQGGGGLKA